MGAVREYRKLHHVGADAYQVYVFWIIQDRLRCNGIAMRRAPELASGKGALQVNLAVAIMTVQLDRARVTDIIDDDTVITENCSDIISVVDQLPEIDVPISVLLPSLYLRESGTSHAHVQLLA